MVCEKGKIMCISPIGYQPFVANNNYIRFQSNPITSAKLESDKGIDIGNTVPLTASHLSTISAWQTESQTKNPQKLYRTAEIQNKKYAGIKNLLPAEQKELIELIEELPLIEDAKTKRIKLYLEAENNKNKLCNKAREKKIEADKEAEEKKDKICKEAEKARNKEYKKAEEKKEKEFREAEERIRDIYLIAKRRYDLNIISKSEFNELLSSAQKQCEKSKSDASKKYKAAEITANKNYESTEKAARRECENTQITAYRECQNSIKTAYRECDINKLSADVEYKKVLNLHQELKETVGEYVYGIIIEQKKAGNLAEQELNTMLTEHSNFYESQNGKSYSNITAFL